MFGIFVQDMVLCRGVNRVMMGGTYLGQKGRRSMAFVFCCKGYIYVRIGFQNSEL